MNEATERGARQRELIEEALAAYGRGSSTLEGLIQDLQALALELWMVPQEWLAGFQAEVNELEVLYAVALDRGVADALPADYRVDADEAVNRLEFLLQTLPPPADDAGA
ncbi:hypothetical protein HET69_37440 [Streptomyces sp. CJ_13]|uniref:hypothetical protein n=1 Tax=Streptomyces sp. CJ_13 TaxID=2724943 RepID=UPI001BDC71A6|nr:hypothetical protein [Streptomyces sp. CJ_13]MBT1189520.1 hypothetical protein [Streptomyces sp. CJ_13]